MKQLLLLLFIFFANIVIAQPANNLCTAPNVLTPGTTCTNLTLQTLFSATATGSPTNVVGTTNDVWYTFTTPANIRNMQVTVTPTGTRNGSYTNATTYIEAFNGGTCTAGTFSGGSSIGTTNINSNLSLNNLSPGTTYYVRVLTTNTPTAGAAANWQFSICATYTAVPGNDNCSNATLLTAGTSLNNQTVQNASASAETVGCATGTPDDDVWYRFTTGTTQRYATIVLTPGATLNSNGAMIQLYSGSCGSLTSIACGQNELSVNSGLNPSTQYYVRVYSASTYSTTPTSSIVSNNFNILLSSPSNTTIRAGKTNEVYRQTTISTANSNPWEVTYGPDNFLWITEARGYRLNRMNPVTGAKQVVLDLSFGSTFLPLADRPYNAQFNIYVNGAQGGFAGMALHPQFTGAAGGQNYVYLGYVHTLVSGINFTSRVVRFLYNHTTNRLESPVSICDTIPGSGDHNSQRMIIAPMTQGGSDYYLFYAVGDMGAGQQFPSAANIIRPMKAQVINSYEGKVLRFGLSDTCGGSGLDRWIPASNPYNNISPIVGKSAVWNIGQRNNQGFAYNPALNILYGASHGPFSDDEINIIESKKNYGHPRVIGYASDGNYNGTSAPKGGINSYAAGVAYGWTGTGYPAVGNAAAAGSCDPIGDEMANVTSMNANAATLGVYQDPIYSAYPGPSSGAGSIPTIWQTASGNSGWHSEAWSGLDLYTSNVIPGWKNTLLAAGLKWGRMIRLKLNDAGTAVVKTIPSLPSPQGDTVTFFQSDNRYRDMAFSPNGREIYVAMDSSAAGSAATVGSPTSTVASCRGCIVRYEFLGYNPTGTTPFPSTIPDYIPVDSSTSGGCVTATAVTINTANGNNNLWVPITGPNGNIIAEIDANGNNIGNITTSFFTRTTPAARTAFGTKYLNRNVNIGVQTQPSTSVSVRLYITAKELADLIATTGSGVTGVTDIGVYKNNDACGTAMVATPTKQVVTGRYVQSSFGHAIQFNVSSFSSFYFGSTSSTLPYELFTFTGKAVNDASKLEWVVNNQVDVTGYDVQRSLDNINFESIATVQAKTGGANITYNFTDFNAARLGSIIYYRIRSIENSGAGKYSNVINVNFAQILITSVTLFPNPVTEKTNVVINAIADETAQLKVVDNIGRVVYSVSVKLVKGKNNIQLDMSKFNAGLYYVDITGKAINEKTKLIKQ